MHASRYFVSLQRGQEPAEGRFETLKEPCVDVVRIEVSQFHRAFLHLQFLSQRISKAIHSELAGAIVRITLTSDVSCD